MALVFLPEIGAALTALGQAALTAIGIGAVLSLSGDTSKEKSQAKAQAKGSGKGRRLVMETVKVPKSLSTDIKFTIKERGK